MSNPIRNLKHDQRGAAVIELALSAPLLAAFVIGMVDLSNAYGRKLILEQSAQRGIEKIMQTTVDQTVDATIVHEAAAAADIPEAQVTLKYWLECDTTEQDDYHEDECTDAQVERRYITLELTDSYDPLFPISPGTEADGKYHMTAKAGIRIK